VIGDQFVWVEVDVENRLLIILKIPSKSLEEID